MGPMRMSRGPHFSLDAHISQDDALDPNIGCRTVGKHLVLLENVRCEATGEMILNFEPLDFIDRGRI